MRANGGTADVVATQRARVHCVGLFTIATGILLLVCCEHRRPATFLHADTTGANAGPIVPPAPQLPPRQREVYGDPKIFDMPRLQFVWRGYGDTIDLVWSVKTDGTDLREVVDAGFLHSYEKARFAIDEAVRSPDGRWLAICASSSGKYAKPMILYDLRERTVKMLGNLSLSASFTRDSKEFYFLAGGDVTRCDLATGQITDLGFRKFYPTTTIDAMFVPKSSCFAVATNGASYTVLDEAFGASREVKVHSEYLLGPCVSIDGSRIAYVFKDSVVVREVSDGSRVKAARYGFPPRCPALDESGSFAYFFSDRNLVSYGIPSGNVKILFWSQKEIATALTFFNPLPTGKGYASQ